MLYCDLTREVPAEDLAADEALLDLCGEGAFAGALRFWTPRSTFVVVGYGNHVGTEAKLPECESAGIPVFRRCSGGGTVLQAPGCLNYTLVMRVTSHPKLAGISGTNDYVMERNRRALQSVVKDEVRREGHTDLAIAERKFCGNAQRRRKNSLIFHGCFLIKCDLPLIERFLQMPSKQPDYRADRGHLDFVRNLNLPETAVKEALRNEWGAEEMLFEIPEDRIAALVREKYSRAEWNLKF